VVSAAIQIVLVPVPVASWLTRYPGSTPREHKTPANWPLGKQPIPQPDRAHVRELIERGRRTLADERERRAIRELGP
jgi:hypothetical protein